MTEPNLNRDASDRLCFDDSSVEVAGYPAVCVALRLAFDLMPLSPLITNGLDVIFWRYSRGDQIIELAWDNWSGFMVTAITPGAEPLVREIAMWFAAGGWRNTSG